jgi:DNA-directed RNA polymerase subunit L
MDAFSKFQMTVENPVWTQQPTTEHNALCNRTKCYNNCHEDCWLDFSLDPTGLKGCIMMDGETETCLQCDHPLQDHQHYRVKWVETVDKQVAVNPEMQKRWENAKDDKEKNEVLLASYEEALNGCNQHIDEATQGLARLAEDYSYLSLSGSFSAQVEKAVRLLQQSYKGMESKGVDEEQLQKMREALDVMKKKLSVLKEANAKRKRETVWLGRVAQLIGWK